MSLPANFSGYSHEDAHRYFRNLCIEFKKTVKSSKNSIELQQEMEQFMDASRQMNWHHKQTGVYRKEEGDKAADKVWAEFKRYVTDLQTDPDSANPQDLLDALGEVERLIKSLKTT